MNFSHSYNNDRRPLAILAEHGVTLEKIGRLKKELYVNILYVNIPGFYSSGMMNDSRNLTYHIFLMMSFRSSSIQIRSPRGLKKANICCTVTAVHCGLTRVSRLCSLPTDEWVSTLNTRGVMLLSWATSASIILQLSM